MRLNRYYLYTVIYSIALLTVLLIQINWIFKTARIKEELFNEKANMVLVRTAEALSSDTEACRNIESGMEKSEINKIDSLINHYMNFYNFQLMYSFEVKPPIPFLYKGGSFGGSNVYNKRLDEVVSKNGLELKLVFPEKKQFILEEMGVPFITSVALIILLFIMFWQTTLSLLKERKVSEHAKDFVNNMAHEFKTPLTNIALAAKMMIRETPKDHEQKIKHYSGIIQEENEKLKQQVEHVLSMTALEKGEMPFNPTKIDIHQIITEALKCMSVQLEDQKGRVDINLAAVNFIVNGDKIQLTAALCNLIDNAIKYTNQSLELIIQTTNKDGQIIIRVSDNGKGIEKNYHKQIFEKYFRIPTGNRHDVKGFGLGLAYVKKVLQLHGAVIEVNSVMNKGTTFIITMPHE